MVMLPRAVASTVHTASCAALGSVNRVREDSNCGNFGQLTGIQAERFELNVMPFGNGQDKPAKPGVVYRSCEMVESDRDVFLALDA